MQGIPAIKSPGGWSAPPLFPVFSDSYGVGYFTRCGKLQKKEQAMIIGDPKTSGSGRQGEDEKAAEACAGDDWRCTRSLEHAVPGRLSGRDAGVSRIEFLMTLHLNLPSIAIEQTGERKAAGNRNDQACDPVDPLQFVTLEPFLEGTEHPANEQPPKHRSQKDPQDQNGCR